MSEVYQQIIEVLERRYYEQPVPPSQLLLHAKGSAGFTQYWLSHAIASAASPQELAVVVALAASHQLPSLALLQQYWGSAAPALSQQRLFLAQLQPFAGFLPLAMMLYSWTIAQ